MYMPFEPRSFSSRAYNEYLCLQIVSKKLHESKCLFSNVYVQCYCFLVHISIYTMVVIVKIYAALVNSNPTPYF